jgi:hypothetical protein
VGWATHHQPPGRLAQQDQEESSPCPPKHLSDHRGTTEYPDSYRMHHHSVRSRRSSPTWFIFILFKHNLRHIMLKTKYMKHYASHKTMNLHSMHILLQNILKKALLKKLHSEKKSSIYTETYIFDTYIFGTDYTILWSFLFI